MADYLVHLHSDWIPVGFLHSTMCFHAYKLRREIGKSVPQMGFANMPYAKAFESHLKSCGVGDAEINAYKQGIERSRGTVKNISLNESECDVTTGEVDLPRTWHPFALKKGAQWIYCDSGNEFNIFIGKEENDVAVNSGAVTLWYYLEQIFGQGTYDGGCDWRHFNRSSIYTTKTAYTPYDPDLFSFQGVLSFVDVSPADKCRHVNFVFQLKGESLVSIHREQFDVTKSGSVIEVTRQVDIYASPDSACRHQMIGCHEYGAGVVPDAIQQELRHVLALLNGHEHAFGHPTDVSPVEREEKTRLIRAGIGAFLDLGRNNIVTNPEQAEALVTEAMGRQENFRSSLGLPYLIERIALGIDVEKNKRLLVGCYRVLVDRANNDQGWLSKFRAIIDVALCPDIKPNPHDDITAMQILVDAISTHIVEMTRSGSVNGQALCDDLEALAFLEGIAGGEDISDIKQRCDGCLKKVGQEKVRGMFVSYVMTNAFGPAYGAAYGSYGNNQIVDAIPGFTSTKRRANLDVLYDDGSIGARFEEMFQTVWPDVITPKAQVNTMFNKYDSWWNRFRHNFSVRRGEFKQNLWSWLRALIGALTGWWRPRVLDGAGSNSQEIALALGLPPAEAVAVSSNGAPGYGDGNSSATLLEERPALPKRSGDLFEDPSCRVEVGSDPCHKPHVELQMVC